MKIINIKKSVTILVSALLGVTLALAFLIVKVPSAHAAIHSEINVGSTLFTFADKSSYAPAIGLEIRLDISDFAGNQIYSGLAFKEGDDGKIIAYHPYKNSGPAVIPEYFENHGIIKIKAELVASKESSFVTKEITFDPSKTDKNIDFVFDAYVGHWTHGDIKTNASDNTIQTLIDQSNSLLTATLKKINKIYSVDLQSIKEVSEQPVNDLRTVVEKNILIIKDYVDKKSDFASAYSILSDLFDYLYDFQDRVDATDNKISANSYSIYNKALIDINDLFPKLRSACYQNVPCINNQAQLLYDLLAKAKSAKSEITNNQREISTKIKGLHSLCDELITQLEEARRYIYQHEFNDYN